MQFKNKDISNLSMEEKIGIIGFANLNSLFQFAKLTAPESFVIFTTKINQISLNLMNAAIAALTHDKEAFNQVSQMVKDDVAEFILMHRELMNKFQEVRDRAN